MIFETVHTNKFLIVIQSNDNNVINLQTGESGWPKRYGINCLLLWYNGLTER